MSDPTAPVLAHVDKEDAVSDASGFRIIDGVPWVGDRSFPWAKGVRVSDLDAGTYPWRSRGFHLQFENGYTLSVQWGMGNYCVNHDSGFRDGGESFRPESPNAEIALWNKDDAWFNWGTDNVRGWCSAADVLKVIEAVATWPTSQFGPNPLRDGDDE